MRATGAFLVVDDPLERGAAIVVLGGSQPFRAMEAAEIYRAGWAQRVFIVPGINDPPRAAALSTLGIEAESGWQLNQLALIRFGVPQDAVLIARQQARNTHEELQAVVRELEGLFGGESDGQEVVILVTSPYHTRRVLLTWQRVADPRWRGVVRAANQDPFDPDNWWRDGRWVRTVTREYLGLANLFLGFPVGPR